MSTPWNDVIPSRVITFSNRVGIAVYDNAATTDNTHPSVIVVYRDGTYTMEARGTLANDLNTSSTGGSGSSLWIHGIGPGQ